ncbi:RBBP9/YdeN family alpha/beta hydrolase, partial [Rhodococcus aetherivorans]|uniref:RBBP9/YdeN family alpha/beta hydrolase n=1 Tax=Rhodococcus aetherivorans TaxID=191292 RepID=UPI0017A564A2|nr:alpha/beta hydrolase [Rhodococcus aetherivorans]
MSTLDTTTVVIVPGLRGHVAEHWQTLLAARLPKVTTVEPLQRDKFGLAARVAALDEVVAGTTGPVLLVAHSAGVMITVAWAQRHDHPVVGALLATPPDLTVVPGYTAPENRAVV